MRVIVDWDLCESNALCMREAPEVFEVRDDDNLYILQENPPESLRDKVKAAERVIDCTATEFKLLAILMERQGRVQERDRLLTDVWGYDSVIDTRTVDTHMRRLRDKLGPHGSYIETIRGFGYRLAPQEET